jgi:hypothetical protein
MSMPGMSELGRLAFVLGDGAVEPCCGDEACCSSVWPGNTCRLVEADSFWAEAAVNENSRAKKKGMNDCRRIRIDTE